MKEPLRSQWPQLQEICSAYGLIVIDACLDGEVLTLVPERFGTLPTAEVLREIADAVGPLGYRYVTLSLDEAGR